MSSYVQLANHLKLFERFLYAEKDAKFDMSDPPKNIGRAYHVELVSQEMAILTILIIMLTRLIFLVLFGNVPHKKFQPSAREVPS